VIDRNDPRLIAAAKAARAELWRRGELSYKFHATQKRILEALQKAERRKFFLLCSRRLGKTFMLLTLAFETALKKPGSRILFLAPVGKNAAEIATDTARQVLKDCPANLHPTYNGQAREFTFKNGSIIRLKGVNSEHADDLRGGATDLAILDEAGQMNDLANLVSGVVMPMTMTVPGSRIIFATTPPTSPGHDSKTIYEDLAADGCAVRFTILDSPHVSNDVKAEYLVEAGEAKEDVPLILAGKMEPKTTTAQREYFCRFVTSADQAVVPEFPAKRDEIVVEWPRAPYFDCYTSIDPGFNDKTGILYAWYDFARSKIVVEDESLLSHASTFVIAEELLRREAALWEDKTPLLRVSDIDHRLAADLWEQNGLLISPAQKQNSIDAINYMRNLIATGRIIINPRCTNLVRQLNDATWNRKATDFARAGDTSPDGHYDLLAALKYLCRAVNMTRNPYPSGYMDGDRPNEFRSPRRKGPQNAGLLPNTRLGRRLSKKKTT
jgi:hypothetical protein